MASFLTFTILLLSWNLWNATIAQQLMQPRPYAKRSLCERAPPAGTTRRCYTGGCPGGWSVYRANNYLMCFANPRASCCEAPPPTTAAPTTTPVPSINHPECGRTPITQRIVRGSPETKCASPWQVSLRRITDVTRAPSILNSNHVAGGVLVQSRWILTTPLSALFAGRITPDERFSDTMVVSLGDFDHSSNDGDEQLVRVRRVLFHPSFRSSTNVDFQTLIIDSGITGTETVWQENAFALIELEEDVSINECVRPACLPTADEERNPTSFCKLTGWGANENEELLDVLLKAEMFLIDGAGCAQLEADINRTSTVVPYPARTGCAVNAEGSFACIGDFGGPVVCQNDPTSRFIVEGLAITQLDCTDDAIPMRVAMVREAMQWIENTLRNSL